MVEKEEEEEGVEKEDDVADCLKERFGLVHNIQCRPTKKYAGFVHDLINIDAAIESLKITGAVVFT